jgi:hypothetical protein
MNRDRSPRDVTGRTETGIAASYVAGLSARV